MKEKHYIVGSKGINGKLVGPCEIAMSYKLETLFVKPLGSVYKYFCLGELGLWSCVYVTFGLGDL